LKPSAEVAAQFGRNLARCRRRAGLSQEALGYRAQVHRTAVSLMERGKTSPRAETIVKLAGGIPVPVDELLDGLSWTPDRIEAIEGGFEVDGEREAS
jgi:transcriptional regulator with XRE-family HTH domain